MKSIIFSAVALLASQTSAHMAMTYPPPLRSKQNPFTTDIDYSITSPMSMSGSDYPCKGTLNLLGTAQGKPVATWQAGQQYNMTITGGANHNGGSCQAALSYDSGKTFTVIHSYIGNCPPAGTSTFNFKLPADAPAAQDALFAWTWFNNVGNREFYMNCAVVTVNGGAAQGSAASSSFASRPQIFKANIGNGCSTSEGHDVQFPSPGPDVDSTSSSTAPPVGNCGVASGGGGGSSGGGSGGSSPAPSNNPVASSVPVQQPSNPVQQPSVPAAVPSSAPAAAQPSPVAPVSSVTQGAPQASLAPTTVRSAGGSVPSVSLPGGVFIPVSSSTSCYTEVETKTTLATVSKPVQTNAVPTTQDIAPVPTPTPLPSGGNNAPGSMTAGLACTEEGQWLCIEGTHFQRCASGRWSVIMSMAAGTKCQSGTTEFVTWAKKRNHKRAHARRLSSRHI